MKIKITTYTTYPEAQKNSQAMLESSFRKALIAEKACSIGFKYGKYGGKKRSLQPKFYASIKGD